MVGRVGRVALIGSQCQGQSCHRVMLKVQEYMGEIQWRLPFLASKRAYHINMQIRVLYHLGGGETGSYARLGPENQMVEEGREYRTDILGNQD